MTVVADVNRLRLSPELVNHVNLKIYLRHALNAHSS
jgi:hypothetical protein